MKMRSDCFREVVERHPALASVQTTCRDECMLVKLVCHRGEHWVGVRDARWASGGVCGGFTDGESRVGIDFGDGVGPQYALVWLDWGRLKRRCDLWVGGGGLVAGDGW